MKWKKRKVRIKRTVRDKKRVRIVSVRKNSRKSGQAKRKKKRIVRRQIRLTDARAVRAVSAIRRGISASKAAQREGMKLKTLRGRAGRYLYRSGPGKPWKARSEDELAVSMNILTRQGRVDAIVRNSRERKLLHRYELLLTRFRAGDEKAEAELKALNGKKVAGYTLITDPKLLIELEEAGQLDFDNLYTSLGDRS